MAKYNKIPKARIIYIKELKWKSSKEDPCECKHREGCKCDDCTGKRKSEIAMHMQPYSSTDYLGILWACPGSSSYNAGFRTNDRIVAVNDVFGKCDRLMEELDRPYVDTKRPIPNTSKLKFLVMDRVCYDYYRYKASCNKCDGWEHCDDCDVYGNKYMETKYFQGRIHNKTICMPRDKTLQDLCCDYFKLAYTFENINNVFEQLHIPLPIQDRIKDAYDFYYTTEDQGVNDTQERTDLSVPYENSMDLENDWVDEWNDSMDLGQLFM